jgi:8-oxo-dGTP pyrophosphatase MutT (NUDIX family)
MQVNETTRVVVSAILLTGKGILVLQRAKDFKGLEYGRFLWDLPGGEISFGEDIYTALTREIKEETGCDVHIDSGEVDVITEVLSAPGIRSFRINIIVTCRAMIDDIILSEEHCDHRFVTNAGQLDELQFLPNVSAWLHKHIQKLLL